jgi:FMN phosphatase YigB (HAD superfamily)
MPRDQRTVFFDVGNVLANDDPFLAEAFRFIHQAIPRDLPKAQMERYLGDVERALRSHGHMAVERIGYRFHGRRWPKLRKEMEKQIERKWHGLIQPVPGARSGLHALRETYRLGIIANQPPQLLGCLEEWRLLPLFDVVLLDSQHGVSKPDLPLFRMALEQARVDPDRGMMVGDRLDNDIIPARRAGMRAVLLCLDVREKGWVPRGDWGRRIWEIMDRLPLARWDAIHPKERPLGLARRWEDLPAVLEKAWTAEI